MRSGCVTSCAENFASAVAIASIKSGMGSTIRTSVYLSVLGSIQQFILVWIMSKGGPINASETLATYMIRFGFVRFQLGYASAVAIYMFILCLTFSLVYQRLARQQDYLTGL